MYNWNAHMRGAGFPLQSQQLMQIPGAHLPQMPYQLSPHQWAQHQGGMGMMMTHNWPPSAQPQMFSPHRLPHGHMTGPATTMMGGLGPAPPSQPPPPLPAEPPPPSPKAQALPPPPPPNQKDTHTPPQPEKSTKLDQAERQQSSVAECVTVPGQPRPPQIPGPDQPKPPHSPGPDQPRPPQSPAPGQPRPPPSPAPGHPRPPQSPAPGQPRPPHSPGPDQPRPPQSPAPGQPKPPQSQAPNQANPRGLTQNQVNPRGPAPNQVNPRGPAPNQVNPRAPAPNQANPRGSAPHQVNPRGPIANQLNPRGPVANQAIPTGPASNQVNPRGPAPNQVNPQGPAPNQVNPRGPALSQVNSQGLALTQTDPYQHLASGQPTPQGQALGLTNPIHNTASGHSNSASVPESDKLPHPEKTVPDPVLVAELEKVKIEETLFMEQYKQWKQQYDEWREQNQNHPNKQQFEQYLEQWRTYEQQMEIRRKDIEVQKQNIENKLSLSQASPLVSQLGPHWEGTPVQSVQVENTTQDRSGKPCWDRDGLQVHDQRSGDFVTDPSKRSDISQTTGPAMSARVNTFSNSSASGKAVSSAVHQSSYNVDEDKGEEDMNIEDDGECGVGGIIESGQHVDRDRNVWPEKLAANSNSYQQHSDDGWNSWNQGPDNRGRSQRGGHGDSLSRGVAAESAGTTEWTSQRGSHRGSLESSSLRGRGRGGWNNVDPGLKSTFDTDLPGMDSDLRLMRPTDGGNGYGKPDDEYAGEEFNGDQNDEFGDGEASNIDDFYSGRGGFMAHNRPWQRAMDRDFQRGRGGGDLLRGRGGEFLRGRGTDFQMGRGDFHRGRGGDFFRGWRGNFPVGRGDFQGGRRGDFQMGMRGDFMNEGEGGMFNNSFGPEDFEHGRGPPRGRGGLPSLLSFDLKESLRHPLAGFDPTGEETRGWRQEAEYDTDLEGQRVVRDREAQRYLSHGDEDDSSSLLPLSRREIGVEGRGDVDGEHGRGGFRSDPLDRGNQSDLSLRLRGQVNMNNSSLNDGQRFLQQGRGETGGLTREGALFCHSEEFQIPGDLNLRDNLTGSMKGREMDPGRPGSNWENQREDNVASHFDRPHNQQNSEVASGIGLLADRGRIRRMPDEDEPEVKKGRFSLDDEREEISRHMDPYQGDPYRAPTGDRKTYRDYRDPYVEKFSGRPSHGYDHQIPDRFGTRSSVFEPHLDRRSLLPAESIDYGHGGVGRDIKAVKPAEVIDYGHGQSTESKSTNLVLDRERMSNAALADRSYPDVLRGGAEVRASREDRELGMMSELIDRETSLRRPESSVRGAMPRYGLRGEQLGEEAGRGTVPGNFRGWLGDSGDDNFDSDLRGDRASTRDRFNEEDDLRRGHRMTRFIPRDDRAGSGAKLFEGQGDDRPILREHGLSNVRRGNQDYSVTDDYYGRRGDLYGSRLTDTYADRGSEYIQDPDQVPDEDDYVAPTRDGRYSSTAGGDVYNRDDRARGHALDRENYSRAVSPPARSTTPLKASTVTPLQSKTEIVKVEDLLCPPNRESRPSQIVTIIRGLPGSGKTYTSKLLREKEISCGGAAPRMLCLDDYFMLEAEREVVEADTGRKVKKRVLEYEYEQALEETYRQSLLKSFKKTIDDGFFPFIIVDATNEKVAHFSEFWSYAKSKGFQVYVGELNSDVPTCIQRNIHHWTEWDIEKVKNSWEPLPSHYIRLDLRWLLQEDSIPEVIMEDTQADDEEADKDAEDEDEESDLKEVHSKSRWELDTSGETLDKLDGIRVSKKHIAEHQSLNDYLQLDQMDDDYFSRESLPGKKRVRWADLEEKKSQSRRRNLGFIVGQTQQDWERITDDDLATKALNQTKYFYKN